MDIKKISILLVRISQLNPPKFCNQPLFLNFLMNNFSTLYPALLFPAIPLMMISFGNRYTSLATLIRKIHDEYVFEKHTPPEWKDQLINLNSRIGVLKFAIMSAAFGFLFNMLTVLGLYLNEIFIARVIFGSCCLSMIISIMFFIREIHISTNALKLHMSDMDVKVD